MADVTGERGQLFLVGALALAVLFVSLALLMNTAIYTENVSTRDTNVGTADAVGYRSAVEAGGAELVRHVNRRHDAPYGSLETNLSAGVDTLRDATGVHEAYAGNAVNVSLAGTTPGTRISHLNGTRAFTTANEGDGTPGNWTLVPDANGTRAFAANVTRSALTNATDADGSTFRVVVDDGSESGTWTAFVYDNRSENAVSVKVKNGSDDISTGQCLGPTDAEHVVVDFTRGTVGGEPCPLLDFAKGVPSPYAISFENGHRAAGTYGLVVRGSSLDGETDPDYGSDPAVAPAAWPAIYDATLAVEYEGPRVEYRSNVTVAPEAEP